MIEEVVKFKTNDGKLFDSEMEAKKYIENLVQEEFNEEFKKIETSDLKFRDLIKIIDHFTGNYNKIVKIRDFLNKILGE